MHAYAYPPHISDRSVAGVRVIGAEIGQVADDHDQHTSHSKSGWQPLNEVISTQELQEQDVWENDIHSPSLSTGGDVPLFIRSVRISHHGCASATCSITLSPQLHLLSVQSVAGSNHVTVGFRQPGSDSSSESDYDEQLAKKVGSLLLSLSLLLVLNVNVVL